jgi:hypothetical protein
MSSNLVSQNLTLPEVVARCQAIMSHAWMVRTFVKHSPEVEDFPELMQVVRTVFDTARALETRLDDPPAYLQMLRKKIGRLRQAANRFRTDAPQASDHTNFRQAVISLDTCLAELEELLSRVPQAVPARHPTADKVGEPPGAVIVIDEDQTE